MAKIGNRDPKAVSLDSFFAVIPRHTRKVGVYMNNITIFNNSEFGDIRTIMINNEPWFVGKDVSDAFGDSNYRRSLSRLDSEEKTITKILTSGGYQNLIVINESGLYSLLFYMQPAKAKGVSQNDTLVNERIGKLKKFKRWVTSEVLPSIRNTGSYSIDGHKPDSYTIEDPIERAKRWIEEQEEKQKLIETVQEQAPKAEYFDSLVNSNLLTNFRDTAKELGYSQTEFTGWLIAKGYVYKDSKGILKPYETYRKQGLFQMKDFKNPYNHFTGTRTFVTVKGKNTFRLLMQVPD